MLSRMAFIALAPYRRGPDGRKRSRDLAPRDHRHVVGQAVERGASIAEGMGVVEVEPPQPGPREDVIEVHPHREKPGRGPAHELVRAETVPICEGVAPAAVPHEAAVDRGAR